MKVNTSTNKTYKATKTGRNIINMAAMLLTTCLSAPAFSTVPQDIDVTNKRSFCTDVIYQIVTDRFVNGNSSNNPTGSAFSSDPANADDRLYHGGDWQGVTNKITP